MENGRVLFRKDVILGMAVVLIAAVVRIIGLRLDSLWFDEAFSVCIARLGLSEIISLAATDVHPPLYYLLLHSWTRLFGETESAVRMLSVVFSVLTVLVIYHLALTLFDRHTAILTALLTAFSPLQVFYAQETRMYAQLTFLSTISMYLFLRWLKDGQRLSAVLYVISTALLLYTHLYAVFVVMAQFLYFASLFFLAREKFQKRWRGWVMTSVIIGLLFVPWTLIAFQQAARARGRFWIKEPDWFAPIQTLFEYSGSVWLTLLLLPLFVYGVKRCCEQRVTTETPSLPRLRAFLLLWLILPISLPFVLSKLMTPFYLTKYTLAASLPFYLFTAVGLVQVRNVAQQAIVVLLICICIATVLKSDLKTLKRERWRDAAYNVEREAQAGDLVLFNSAGSYLSYAYYVKRRDLPRVIFPYSASAAESSNEAVLLQRGAAEAFGSVNSPNTEQKTTDLLRKEVGDHKRVWIVTRYGDGFKNEVMNAFRNEFRATTQPALCVRQMRFLYSEELGETESAIYLQRVGLSCSPQVYLLER
ncbi:MAG: glycosyltransferase family 39 protein [Pyrinomonadaceae bacterium]